MGETSGFVKFIADAKTDELLGAHLIGPNVSELVSEIVLAFEYRGSSEDIGMTVPEFTASFAIPILVSLQAIRGS